jgi:hypothetical protein
MNDVQPYSIQLQRLQHPQIALSSSILVPSLIYINVQSIKILEVF